MKLQAKITMLSVVVGFCMIWSLLFPFSVHGYESQSTQWIIDEHQVLGHAVNKRLTHVLKETFLKRNVHVKIFILNHPSQEPIEELAITTVRQWEKSHLQTQVKKQTAYLVINSLTNKSEIVLAPQVSKAFEFMEGIRHIKEDILIPALEINDINKAAWEGAIALSMILENWPQTLTLQQEIRQWLANNHLTFLPQCLKWIFYLTVLGALIMGLKRYFRSSQPHWKNSITQVNLSSFEEALRASDIAYWRESQARLKELETRS